MQISDPNDTHTSLHKPGYRSPYLLVLIWLVWLPLIIPSFVKFFQSSLPLPRFIIGLLGAALFFIIYLAAAWHRARRFVATSSLPWQTEASEWLTIAALAALSFGLTVFVGNEWQALFFYTSGFVGGSLPIRRAILVAVALALLVILAGWLIGMAGLDIVQGLVFIPAVVFITRSVMWSITTSWELRAAREEIARLAVMTERLRIARDLHDLLGHSLSLITLKSELAGRLVRAAPERAISEISDIENVARTTLQEVREAVGSYRQPTLASELQGAQEILTAAGIAYRYEGDEKNLQSLPATIEAVLAWTLREGVTNVIRHSRAHQCTIRLTYERKAACMEVTNDGVKASADSLNLSSTTITGGGGNGLRGLRERVAALGGRCESGLCGKDGFRLVVSVPLSEHAKSREERSALL